MANGHQPVTPKRGERDRHGFVLLIVLWTLAVLALLGSHITVAARGMLGRDAALLAAAQASALADGAVAEAILAALQPPPRGWPADGTIRRVGVPAGSGTVTIEDHAGRINPSTASAPLMAALLRRIGVDAPRSARIAAALVAWHGAGDEIAEYRLAGLPWAPPHDRFHATGELALVLGMTPDILARLAPFISVYTDGRVDITRAAPEVAAALQDAGAERSAIQDEGGPRIVEITARVELPNARALRRVVVRIDPNDDNTARPWRVLAWQ